MPSRNTYHLTWVCPTFKEGYLLTAAPPDLEGGVAPLGPPVPAQPLLLTLDKEYLVTLDKEYLLIAAPPDLERGVAPLGPPAPMQPPLLGCRVAPLTYHP